MNKNYKLKGSIEANLYVQYLLSQGFSFKVHCYTTYIGITVTVFNVNCWSPQDEPKPEWLVG